MQNNKILDCITFFDNNFMFEIRYNVLVDVVDMQGRQIETLVDNSLMDGYHRITWDASDRASGVYFVRLSASSEILTQKVMLIK